MKLDYETGTLFECVQIPAFKYKVKEVNVGDIFVLYGITDWGYVKLMNLTGEILFISSDEFGKDFKKA